MKHTPSLGYIILVLPLIVTFAQPAACHTPVWDERLVPPGHVRHRYNPRRNRERWARRWAKRQRQRPPVRRAARCRHRTRILRQILSANPSPGPIGQRKQQSSPASVLERATMEKPSPIAETPSEPDHPSAGANTQPDGSYIIQALPSGNYKVQITASGQGSTFKKAIYAMIKRKSKEPHHARDESTLTNPCPSSLSERESDLPLH